MVWLLFIVFTGALVFFAQQLTRSGDVLAEKTGLGRAWIGALLLAGTTSLPELASGVTAVTALDAPNLAAGGVFGSCLFNLGLIALMDLVYQPGSVLVVSQEVNILSGALGVILIGLASLAVLLSPDLSSLSVLHVGLISVVVLGIYALGASLISRFERRRIAQVLTERAEELNYAGIPTRRAVTQFAISAVLVVGLAVGLSAVSERIADESGLSRSFVGTLFLAFATSLPEVVVGVVSVRMGAIDLAISNVLGSNLFNVALLGVYDAAYLKGSLWANLDDVHAVSGLMAVIMTGVAVVSLIYRASPRTPFRLSWDGFSILVLYITAIVLIFIVGQTA